MPQVSFAQTNEAGAQKAKPSVAYLLVIDRSGSMALGPDGQNPYKGYKGPSRWDQMIEKAKAQVETMPESTVWICTFSGYPKDQSSEEDVFRIKEFELTTSADKQRILDYLDNTEDDGAGAPGGSTALFDAMGLALERAQTIAENNSGSYVSVYFYTDGVDEGSRKYETLADVEAAFSDYIIANRQLDWYLFRLANAKKNPLPKGAKSGDEAKTQISLQLLTTRFLLPNPIDQPNQTVGIRFNTSPRGWSLLTGIQATVTFVPDDGQDIQISTGPLEVKKGEVPVGLTIENPSGLKKDQQYSGRLKLEFANPKYEIKTPDIEVAFRKGEKLEIVDLLPTADSTWVIGRPIRFSLFAAKDTSVTWEFGNGKSASGSEVFHTFETGGTKKVNVSVRGSGSEIPATKSFTLKLVNLPIRFETSEYPVFENGNVRFEGTGSADFSRFEWLIDGQSFPASTAEKDGQKMAVLDHVFRFPGEYDVQLLGRSELLQLGNSKRAGGSVATPKQKVKVFSVPDIELLNGSSVNFSETARFELDLPRSDLRSVQWEFDAAEGVAENLQLADDILRDTDEPVFRYTQSGVFDVVAKVAWSNGLKQTFNRKVTVIAETPVSKPSYESSSGGNSRLSVGATVKLITNSTGDIVAYRWRHTKPDGSVAKLSPDQTTLVLGELGEHVVELEVEGPVDRQTGRAPIDKKVMRLNAYPPSPWHILGFLLFGCGAAVYGVHKLAFNNHPRNWRVRYSANDEIGEDDPRRRELIKCKGFEWNWWNKRGKLPVKSIIKTEYWEHGPGSNEFVSFREVGGTVEISYSREAAVGIPKQVAIGANETQYTWRDKKNPEEQDQVFTVMVNTDRKKYPAAFYWICWLLTVAACVAMIYMYYENNFRI